MYVRFDWESWCLACSCNELDVLVHLMFPVIKVSITGNAAVMYARFIEMKPSIKTVSEG